MPALAPLSTQNAPTTQLLAALRHLPALPRHPPLHLRSRLLRLLQQPALRLPTFLPTASVDPPTMDILAWDPASETAAVNGVTAVLAPIIVEQDV